jgi:hypothetical protein
MSDSTTPPSTPAHSPLPWTLGVALSPSHSVLGAWTVPIQSEASGELAFFIGDTEHQALSNARLALGVNEREELLSVLAELTEDAEYALQKWLNDGSYAMSSTVSRAKALLQRAQGKEGGSCAS